MCKTLTVRATLDDGITPHPECPDVFIFPDGLTDEDLETLPTCTCWIGTDEHEGQELWHIFLDKIRKYLDISYGNVIIEIR